MKRSLTMLVVASAACFAMACGAPDGEIESDGPAELELSLDGKADVALGGLKLQKFEGPLQYGDAKVATVEKAGYPGWSGRYKIGYTFRAKKNAPVTVSVFGENGQKADTIAWIYRQNAQGKFNFVMVRDNWNSTEKFTFKAPQDGIYLLVSSAKKKQNIVSSLGCSNTGDSSACDLPCAVIRLYKPVCGVDGNTYGNSVAAACYAVPVANEGRCPGKLGEYCDTQGKCQDDLFCAAPADAVCAEFGECAKKPEACILVYKPVCGCDGVTYGNACGAAAAGANVASDGECECAGPVDYAADSSEVVGSWWTFSGDYPVEYNFGKDGQFSKAEYISPCPAGVACVWSGIKYSYGTYKIFGTVIGLFNAGNTSATDYDLKLQVKRDCDSTLFLREGGPVDTDYYRGPACDKRPPNTCDYGGACQIEAQGCENPCEPDGLGGVICHPCDPIAVCVPVSK